MAYFFNRRGLGAGATGWGGLFSTEPGSSGHGTCSAAYWQWNPASIWDSACVDLPTLPVPHSQGISLRVGPESDPNAIYAGVDSSGQPVYAVPSTPAQNLDAYRQSLTDWATVQTAPGGAAEAAKCDGFFSFLNPACPSKGPSTLTWVLGGVALALGVVMIGGRR